MMWRFPSVILLIVTVLAGCASAPSKQSVYVSPDSEAKITQMANISVIADVCLMRDVLGDDDYWAVQESRSAEGHMLDATKGYLTSKGYEVGYAEAPFVGAFKDRKKAFKVCDASGGEVVERNPPLFEAKDLADNQAYRDALLNIIPLIPAAHSQNSDRSNICCSSAEMKDQLSVIAKNTGGDATLFLIGHGSIVSTGKQLTQGLATGLLTAVLTLGTVSVSRHNVSFMDTYAVLIDNATGEILWSNAARLKGDGFTDKAYYDMEKWPKSILDHMPSKTIGSVKNEAQVISNENPSSLQDTGTHGEDNSSMLITDGHPEKEQ